MGNRTKPMAGRPGLSVRDAFFDRIFELIQRGGDIVVVTPDLGAPSLDALREHYPDRYISVGIAEQSLISVAVGLALTGKRVVAYGLGPFPVTRAYDQVRCLLSEMDIPVTLCALNAGLCSAECGFTHVPVEDMGMIRILPNMRVYNPTDTSLSEIMADEVLTSNHPRYIRFEKNLRGGIYEPTKLDIMRGFTEYGVSGGLGIVTCGIFVPEVRAKVDELLAQGKRVKVIDLFALPPDRDSLLRALMQCKALLTVEEQIVSCGIGAFILELLAENGVSMPLRRLGLRFENGYYDIFADRTYIRRDQGIDGVSVWSSARATVPVSSIRFLRIWDISQWKRWRKRSASEALKPNCAACIIPVLTFTAGRLASALVWPAVWRRVRKWAARRGKYTVWLVMQSVMRGPYGRRPVLPAISTWII